VARGAPGEGRSFSQKVEGPIKGEWCPGCCNNRKDWRSRIKNKEEVGNGDLHNAKVLNQKGNLVGEEVNKKMIRETLVHSMLIVHPQGNLCLKVPSIILSIDILIPKLN
jgi:hypothetical protein